MKNKRHNEILCAQPHEALSLPHTTSCMSPGAHSTPHIFTSPSLGSDQSHPVLPSPYPNDGQSEANESDASLPPSFKDVKRL